MILIDTQKEEFNKLKDIHIFDKIDNEKRYHGNLLVIGLGGIGSRVVCNLKGMLKNEIKPEDNINFLMIDSDIPEMEAMIEDSKDGLGLNATEIISIYRPNLDNLLVNGIAENPVHPNLANWMKEDFPILNIDMDGARGNRQVGRLMLSNAYEDVRMLLFDRIEEIYNKSNNNSLDIILVSSVAGGTGSGILSDIAYNIRAYAKTRKFTNFRLGGCLLMPDVLYSNIKIKEDMELMTLLNANGYATLKEIDYYMRLKKHEKPYIFESTTHRISMCENIFDCCMLVSGKKDEQGYVPEGIVYSDTAYFLSKLATYKYVGNDDGKGNRKLFRDVFFNGEDRGYYKVINNSDYRIPIREIENISEYEVFTEAYKMLHQPVDADVLNLQITYALQEMRQFLSEKPGDNITISANGLIRMSQFRKPTYKQIKKSQDFLRSDMAEELKKFEENIPMVIKSIKNKMVDALNGHLETYMNQCGPYAVMDIIGAAGIGNDNDHDTGMIATVRELERKSKEYQTTGEFSRIIESIKDIVSKRFFTFPKAKAETENGYYDACVKETLTLERNMIIEGLDVHDVFGDIVRWLRAKAERYEELYAQFDEDLKNAVSDLAREGKRITGFLLKDAKHETFLPSDYITEERVDSFHKGLVRLLVDNESNIDNGRLVSIKPEMERIYKNMLVGLGVYPTEKLIAVAFADEKPNIQETNLMFVSSENETREELMTRAAKAFVEGASEKTQKKKLCILKPGFKVNLVNRKYISLPAIMPHFSEAVKKLLTSAPYKESEDTIALNTGDVAISVDDMYIAVPLSMLACMDDMRMAYHAVITTDYMGLHADEVNLDMVKDYPEIA
ncbi:MAG: tubulin-like doman-containing protein [Lachnospiraceae bacterium]|nr:tubulin-like doman-containing protein [Lachnospiraceae bacterium]